MKLLGNAEFDSFDLQLLHDWLVKRGWEKTTDHPLRYLKAIGEMRLVANNIFDAMKQEMHEEVCNGI